DVPGLACLVGMEAVRAEIRRVERERILTEEGRLPVQREPIEVQRRRSLAEVFERCTLPDVVVEAQLDRGQGEGGGEGLGRRGKRHVTGAEVAVLIFERRAPLSADRDADAGSKSPAGSPERLVIDRRGRELAASQLVVGPGEAARSIEQPG